jgi:hypothetical protein
MCAQGLLSRFCMLREQDQRPCVRQNTMSLAERGAHAPPILWPSLMLLDRSSVGADRRSDLWGRCVTWCSRAERRAIGYTEPHRAGRDNFAANLGRSPQCFATLSVAADAGAKYQFVRATPLRHRGFRHRVGQPRIRSPGSARSQFAGHGLGRPTTAGWRKLIAPEHAHREEPDFRRVCRLREAMG